MEESNLSIIKTEIQIENSSIDVNLNNVSSSDEEEIYKFTDVEDAQASDKPLTKSRLRRMRRTKLTLSGKIRQMKKSNDIPPLNDETLLLGNLPTLWDIEAVESLLNETTGLTKDNSYFYIEMLGQPGQHFAEAYIQFLNHEHLLLAFRKLQAVPYIGFPLTVEIQNSNTPGSRIPNGFQTRFQANMALTNVLKPHTDVEAAHKENTDITRAKNTSNTVEKSNTPANERQPEDEQTHLGANNLEDMMQENSSNNDSTSGKTSLENTQNKISNESNTDAAREKCLAELTQPPVTRVKGEQMEAHDGNSNDSIDTVILKREPIDIDEMATVAPEPVNINNELPIEQESKDSCTNLLAPTDFKQEPQDLHDTQTQVTHSNESNIAIDDIILNNINPSEIKIKHAIIDTLEDNREKKSLTENDASVTAPKRRYYKKKCKKIEISDELGGICDVNETSRLNKIEIVYDPTKPIDQTVYKKKKKKRGVKRMRCHRPRVPRPPDHTHEENKSTKLVDDILVPEEARCKDSIASSNQESPAKSNDESDANHCKIVYIKNLPLTTQNQLLNIIKHQLIKRMNNQQVTDNYDEVLIHILHDEIEHKLLGKALIKFKSHDEALEACTVLNGINVFNNIIEVGLDVGHNILKEHMKFTDSLTCKLPPRKRTKSHDDQNEDEPVAKQLKKTESELLCMDFNKTYLPPEELSMDNYGLKPLYLQNLGLKQPLSNTIVLKELHELVDEDKLYEVFSMAGDIKRIQFCKEKGTARVEYDHPVEAVQAIQMFKNQKLFDKNIVMHMDPADNPRPLPIGLSGVNKGFDLNGEPLRGVRTNIELRNIHEQLYELGKINKYACNNMNAPFNAWYGKRTNNEHSKRNSPENESSTSNVSVTPNVILPSISNETNQNNQPSTDSEIIEALGAILKNRGLIPTDTDCKDAKNILAALQSQPDDQNDQSNKHSNCPSTNTKSPLNNMYRLPNTANVTQSLYRETHAKVPQNFVRDLQNQHTASPRTFIMQHSNFPPAHPAESNTNYRSDDRFRHDPRLVGKGRDSDLNEGMNRVILKNLPLSVTQGVLINKMREVGEVLYCEVTGAGSAIVAFNSLQDAERCFRLFNRAKIDGQMIEAIRV